MNYMSVSQVENALRNNNYILLRLTRGRIVAVNCKILKTKTVKKDLLELDKNKLIPYIGFRPCSFQEYLSNKEPFFS